MAGPVTPARRTTPRPVGSSGQLTAQQTSLIRAAVLKRADYLQQSYYRDPTTGERNGHADSGIGRSER